MQPTNTKQLIRLLKKQVSKTKSQTLRQQLLNQITQLQNEVTK